MMNHRWTIFLVLLCLAAGPGAGAPAAGGGADRGITGQYLPRWQAGYEAYDGKVRNLKPGDGHGVGESSAYARARRAAFFKRALGGPVRRE